MSLNTIMWIIAGIIYLAIAVLYIWKTINDIAREQEIFLASKQRNGKIKYISDYRKNRRYRSSSHSYHSSSLS